MSFDRTPLTYQDKQEIRSHLERFVSENGGIEIASARFADVPEASIREIMKGDRMNIAHTIWLKVGKVVGWSQRHKIKFVETKNSKILTYFFETAKEFGETFAVVGDAGSGKTLTGKAYAKANAGKNVYHLTCAEYLNKDTFLRELLKVMGRNAGGKSVYEMMEEIVTVLGGQDQPLIIIDEVDKLKPNVLSFFITLYNKLHGSCGFVWTSTDAIVERIERGVRLKRIGFNEIFSRIGRKFIPLPGISKVESDAICKANGITDEADLWEVWNDANGDCRRIDRKIIQHQMKNRVA